MKKLMTAAALLAMTACGSDVSGPDDVESLQITDVVVGTGTTATVGQVLTVHYTVWLYDEEASDHKGQRLESSKDNNGEPIDFTLGEQGIIEGWNQGLAGMKVGGRRVLIIPSSLAYGNVGSGPIPPNSALLFDVELLDVQ